MARKPPPSKAATAPSSVTHVFAGWVVQSVDGDYTNALVLVDHRPYRDAWGQRVSLRLTPLAKRVYDVSRSGQQPVTVSYHLTDQPETEDALHALLIAKMCGVSVSGPLRSGYYHSYSEMTGYLYTDETFQVGGHNVIQELSRHLGRWCHLVLTVHPQGK